ncbi:metallophosphoesterase [Epilithonimonas zeae]|uniref:metallophosphoesterase n=1 Tax=Epilithonimonas zeae TaxID=1416779 RepID=UPI00200FF196|nr:metallophosphoesterase [Epilithonimonas zeae]UQB70386.1 metallophosphoesterase [Epilithonimonas zeae]
MQKNILFLLGVFLVLEIYVYQAFKTVYTNQNARLIYWIPTILIYTFLIYSVVTFNRASHKYLNFQIVFSVILIFVLPKILVAIFLLIEDIIRLLNFGYNYVATDNHIYPSRRKFISLVGLGSGAVLAGMVLDGIIFGKYRHKARIVRLKLKNLPASFKGYKIVQISDVHSGSFQNPKKLQHAIDLINEQNADLVLFTGDMVNNYADEFVPFIDLFSQIKGKDGKFAVLGNHDYGEYGEWKNEEERRNNIPLLVEYEKKAGFQMLRNENRIIERNGEKLYILGVENWGIPPFPQFGDLDRATQDVPVEACKILMSHDPSHFDAVVRNHPKDVQLTLSGHTHGMQFGIDLKNFKWSPVKFKYPKWADLYQTGDKYLYVNRGFGVIGYPGRVGVLPEITVFELS